MAVWLDASYFYPRAVDAAPSWVLLRKKAGFSNCDNATTAYAVASAGRTIKVTFCLASPPTASHLRVHCADSRREHFDSASAEVIASAKDLILLRCRFRREPSDDEYFVYHAAAGMPSLRAIPFPPMPCNRDVVTSLCFAILPFEDDIGEFLLAHLSMVEYKTAAYDLRVFSSKTWVWSTRALALAPTVEVSSHDTPCRFDKVITLGGGAIGWVDLHLGGGIVVCDVLNGDLSRTRFIPLPKPDFYKRVNRSRYPVHRDIVCYNDGFIVLVDLDLRFRYVVVDSNDQKKLRVKTLRISTTRMPSSTPRSSATVISKVSSRSRMVGRSGRVTGIFPGTTGARGTLSMLMRSQSMTRGTARCCLRCGTVVQDDGRSEN
jgi:hypothetical protein